MNDEDPIPVVYVVDDDSDILEHIKLVLTEASIENRCFESANDFLESTLVLRPGLLLLDMRMPNKDGFALQAELADLDFEVPILFMSGYADVGTVVEAISRGAKGFLEKPFTDDKLRQEILTLLEMELRNFPERLRRHEMRARISKLTPRETEVFHGVVLGNQNKQIAFDLNISSKTVELHRHNAMKKLKCRTAAQFIRAGVLYANIT